MGFVRATAFGIDRLYGSQTNIPCCLVLVLAPVIASRFLYLSTFAGAASCAWHFSSSRFRFLQLLGAWGQTVVDGVWVFSVPLEGDRRVSCLPRLRWRGLRAQHPKWHVTLPNPCAFTYSVLLLLCFYHASPSCGCHIPRSYLSS